MGIFLLILPLMPSAYYVLTLPAEHDVSVSMFENEVNDWEICYRFGACDQLTHRIFLE